MVPTLYGYCRCSTDESKQDIDRQKRELKEMGATDVTMFFEYASGTKTDRPELQKLLNKVIDGDTIVTTEISRITRSTKQLCDIIDLCKDKHLKLIIKNSITIDCANGELDPMTEAFLQMAGVFAQLERNMTVSRIKSGLSNARAKGVKLGRPQVTAENVPNIFLKHYPKYKAKAINLTEFSRLCDMSRTTIYKYVKLVES
ncbi:MAG: recombinase family protein [Oscillospiraceae bacterium]